MEYAYRAIHRPSPGLIAGMLPLADALDTTGGARSIVDAMLSAVGKGAARDVECAFRPPRWNWCYRTPLLRSSPRAIYAPSALVVSPHPFAVAVLIAASAAYSTPVVILVTGHGRYRFMNLVNVGVPLLRQTYFVILIVASLIFPFEVS